MGGIGRPSDSPATCARVFSSSIVGAFHLLAHGPTRCACDLTCARMRNVYT